MKFLCSLFFSFAALLAGANSLPSFVTVPFFAEAGDMETNSALPIFIGPDVGMRYQQVYNASDFRIRAPDGGYIYAIQFRPDAQTCRFVNASLPSIQVNLSTTSRSADSLSSVFADNIGPDETVVYGPGSLRVLSGCEPFFVIDILLASPFLYNPHAGNLLMEIRNFGGGPIAYMDASEVAGDSVSRVYALDVGSSSGIVDTRGLITGFSVTPIPEPGTASLFVLGLLVLGWHAVSTRPQSLSATSHPSQRTSPGLLKKGGH